MSFDPHNGNIGFVAAKLLEKEMRGEFARADFSRFQTAFLARKEAQVIEAADQLVMIGITQRFLEALANLALKAFGHSRCSTRSVECDQGTKAANAKLLRLGEWFD